MCRISGLAGFFLCLFLTNVFAQSVYRLQPGDRLEVWVAQEEKLHREVVIGPDGWLSFPLGGHLKGVDLTVQEIEAALVDRLTPFFKEKPDLTVMLLSNPRHEPRIFVAGEVATPGAYSFSSGMTVLHGISLAGGLYRPTLPATDRDRAVVVEREIALSQERLKELSARIARLKAELDGAATIDGPRNEPVIAQEQGLLDARRQAIATRQTARRQVDAYGAEKKKAIRAQLDTVETRIGLTKSRLAGTAVLVSKGISEVSQKIELETEIAELLSLRSELTSDLLEADQEVVSEGARLDGVEDERRTDLLNDLIEAQREQETVRARLADSEEIRSIYAAQATDNADAPGRNLGYRIVRVVEGSITELEATEMTPLLAGDLIRVFYRSTGEQGVKSVSTSNQLPGLGLSDLGQASMTR
jgi:protein involved in polysaccharide export with SLBB domain